MLRKSETKWFAVDGQNPEWSFGNLRTNAVEFANEPEYDSSLESCSLPSKFRENTCAPPPWHT
jgi:hypothetical protein